MSEKPTTNLLDEAVALFEGKMLYKILYDGSVYFYTEEYAHKNKDIALHCPSSGNSCCNNIPKDGDKT